MARIPMGDLLRFHAERLGDTMAVAYPDGEVSWDALDRRANRRARFLREQGVRPGDFVTLALPNSVAFFEHSFAIWKLGATPNVVSHRLPKAELEAIVALAKPRLVVTADGAMALDGHRVIAMAADAADLPDDPVESQVAPYWRALTSGGSTGRPKLIVDHTPASYDPSVSYFRLPADGCAVHPGPLYHSYPFGAAHLALFIGCALAGTARFDAEATLAMVERYRAEWLGLVPTMMHRIFALPEAVRDGYDLSSLEIVLHLGAPISPWLKRAWIEWLGPSRIHELYGGTENLGMTWITGEEWLAHPGSVGRMQGEAKLKVVRPDGQDCAAGEIGEVYIRPADPVGGSHHYMGAAPTTLEGGWQTLGDIGWLDAEDYLYLAERRADLILRGGANIYPSEVEAAIEAHPAVGAAVVVGLPDEELGERVHAIVHCPREPLAWDELLAFLRERLVPYKLPETFEHAAEPLRDDAGKVRRSALRADRIARRAAEPVAG